MREQVLLVHMLAIVFNLEIGVVRVIVKCWDAVKDFGAGSIVGTRAGHHASCIIGDAE
jgi:hypothetical protein